ncbi:uncharacterized protein RHOBADRAFT_55890 [Rhodotorula graminis WP1]|uniref:Nickel/cobalt efflux system n=1 Tax=Rhodotorula graminis (strain WP1) TaxID=578459 RepID=A0A0P9ISN6_RHOGW|nr:uncharacterized protein RHOBADRAFT_55890 [Rhodotorula graminis WP1]KPV72424.1 hypothetical protein RHOBADRAFT_55890 [Rhodotorula graminis WP1]
MAISPPPPSSTTAKPARKCAVPRPTYRLTLLGRCLALLAGELVANAAVWTAAACVFTGDKRGVLSLCVVAWTLGLRHGLDMDHIVAVDTTTRALVAQGQRPVTVGLFFSLGHSTIVFAMTVAIIITVRAIDKLPDISSVGGVIGVSVSASFLFLLAVVNAVMLWQTLRMARRRKRLRAAAATTTSIPVEGAPLAPQDSDLALAKKVSGDSSRADDEEAAARPDERVDGMVELPATTCVGRIGRPLFRIIDRPWKMYPVGLLFGLGFDTASSISLLGVSALAGSGDNRIPPGQIIILPLLFMAAMTAVDSADSVFMLMAYTVPQRTAAAEAGLLVEKGGDSPAASAALEGGAASSRRWYDPRGWVLFERRPSAEEEQVELRDAAERARMPPQADEDKLLNISVVLTVISIVVALLISITEFMGLAVEKCASCAEAAENDPGLSGRWWRFWSNVNDNSQFLGVGVIGVFVVAFGGWAAVHFVSRRRARRAGKRRAFD